MTRSSFPQPRGSRREASEGGKRPKRGILRTAIVEVVRKLRASLWMNCHAKRMECVQLAGAVGRQGWCESGSKLRAVQTLRAVRLQLCLGSFALILPLFQAKCRARGRASGISAAFRLLRKPPPEREPRPARKGTSAHCAREGSDLVESRAGFDPNAPSLPSPTSPPCGKGRWERVKWGFPLCRQCGDGARAGNGGGVYGARNGESGAHSGLRGGARD